MHHFGLDTSLKAVLLYSAYYRMYFVVSPKNYDTYTTLYMSKSSFIASEHLEREREREMCLLRLGMVIGTVTNAHMLTLKANVS